MDKNLVYEDYVKGAFSKGLNEKIKRFGDPAKLADGDIFNEGDLNKAKAAIAYSTVIILGNNEDTEKELQKIFSAKNVDELASILNRLRDR
jgi:hypothetical protein